jgi:glycosyltransferase involved in cell wall biosynthesis
LDAQLITDIHGLLGEEAKLKRSRYFSILSEVEKITFHQSDYLLAVSNPMKRQMCLKLKVSPEKVFVVPSGGDTLQIQANFSLPLKVIYAGNFACYERVFDYLELAKAIERNSPFSFFLMGDGVQRDEILSRIDKEKIPITYLGLKTRQEALQIFSQMQVGVMMSRREVAFPLKVMDYMSCGLPVVAPKIGDWGELIDRERCGIAVKKNSVAEFAKALHILCDEEEWAEKSRNGKNCIEREYDWNLALEPLGALIENITS